MDVVEKDYVEQSATDWRKSKFVAADMVNQLNKQEEEQKKRPSRAVAMSKHQSFLLSSSFAAVKKPTASVETQTEETVEEKKYESSETQTDIKETTASKTQTELAETKVSMTQTLTVQTTCESMQTETKQEIEQAV